MTMGMEWVEATPDTGDENNDEARMHRAADPCRYVLSQSITAPAGQEFFYNTGALTLVSAIVRKATGRPLDELAREALFEPLGIAGAEWAVGEEGRYRRRRGICACDRAIWRRSASWSSRAAGGMAARSSRRNGSRRLTAPEDQGDRRRINGLYGYLWWLARSRVNRRDVRTGLPRRAEAASTFVSSRTSISSSR
jgi:CubicO group peptidase (beta-lactamase class C family)